MIMADLKESMEAPSTTGAGQDHPIVSLYGYHRDPDPGEPAAQEPRLDQAEASALVKATAYFLGVDAVGISRCPDWIWYSHDATGEPIEPPHDHRSGLRDAGRVRRR